jgi:hypothetical protein
MCIALGGQSGSESLRDWASRELKGYCQGTHVLPYRVIPTSIVVDGLTSTHRIIGEQVAPYALPAPARDLVKEEDELRGPIAELVDAVASARAAGEDHIKLGIPGGATLAVLVSAEQRQAGAVSHRVERVYKKASVSSFVGVIDAVHTNLVELVAEIRAGLGPGEDLPGKELADRAVNIAIYGQGNRVDVSSIHDSANVAVRSSGVNQANVLPGPGDLAGLKGWLAAEGVSEQDIAELEKAITADEVVQPGSAGRGSRVRAWLGEMALKSAVPVAGGVSIDLIAEAIKHFAGI